MRIENLRLEKTEYGQRSVATITWENSDRSPMDVYFGTTLEFADALSCNPHSFLTACILPAMRHGEKRVFIDAEVCPELRGGLETVMAWIRHWYGVERKSVQIEAKTMSTVGRYAQRRAGFFFSGGIDSLATLRANRLNFPLEHPGSIKDGLLVFGLEIDRIEAFDHVVDSLSKVAQDANITLIPVYTNIRYLDDDWAFWADEFEDACFSAIGHAFVKRFSVVSIASSYDIPILHPHGSHPALSPNYSSYDLRICHDNIVSSRLTKTKLVAEWDVALQHLRVCNKTENIRPGMLNCGKCEKCIRTMLSLITVGLLDKTRAFPTQDVSEELLSSSVNLTHVNHFFYPEMIGPLKEKGRHDLARCIEEKIALYRKKDRRQKVKEFDRKHLKGSLAKFKRVFVP